MFRCLPVCVRNFPCASALLLSIQLVLSAGAHADPGDYRTREETRGDGVHVFQQADTIKSPHFEGTRVLSSAPDTPGIEAGQLRSVRVLVRRSGDTAAIVSDDKSSQIFVEFYNHKLRVSYRGPSISESVNPFASTDPMPIWLDSERLWSLAPTRLVNSKPTHVLVTLYVVPRTADELLREGEGKGKLLVAVNEATVQGMHVVAGKPMIESVQLAVDENNWRHWRQDPLRAGVIPGSDQFPLDPASAFSRRPTFVEQRTVDLRTEAGTRRRDKRCMDNAVYDMSNGLLFPLFMEVYFGRADLCSLDPHPNQDIDEALPLIEVTNPEDIPRNIEPTLFEASATDPAELGHTEAFDAAMAIQFCNTNHRAEDDEAPCTDEDLRATARMGDLLTPQEIDELLAIARMPEPDQPLRTGDTELDRWLNADLVRAEQALTAARAVVHVSSAAQKPTKKIKDKRKKKSKLVKASCVIAENDDGKGDEFQLCVKKARRQIGDTDDFVALTPHVEDRGRFHLRNTAEFNRLVTAFRNTGGGLPDGISGDQFAEFTEAIARDPAPTGDNLGFLFINNPTLRSNARFRYGLEHIWAPGGGGGDNAGHRDDWQRLTGLPVRDRPMLTQLIMAALTDPYARYKHKRSRNGSAVRTFDYFLFRHGGQLYAIKNVRIVLGRNGMVITAYPLRGARADALEM